MTRVRQSLPGLYVDGWKREFYSSSAGRVEALGQGVVYNEY